MKRFSVIMIILAMFMVTSAQAADGKLYLSASGGLSITNDLDLPGINISFSPGYNVGGAVGYDMGQFRAEGEIRYSTVDVDEVNGISFPGSADLSALTFMANGYYDHEINNSPLTPYIGVGIGLVSSEISAAGAGSTDEEDFGYQFMLGLGFDVAASAMLTAEYRYLGIADSDAPDTHAFIFGARFMF
ncbi:MAG TPA: outer membrane beta-barrel protein [Cyclobacteriaceae bacterium]